MNEMVFSNEEFGTIRTVLVEDDVFFVGKDVAEVLGYAEPRSAISKKVDDEDRGVAKMDTPSGVQEMTIINESGLYSLILSSKLPSAKKFKRWVTSEILPAIRKTGSYGKPMTTQEQIKLLALGNSELNERVDSIEADLNKFKLELPLMPNECEVITNLVKAKGVEVLGGKASYAYKDKGLRMTIYQDMYREVKRQFGVTSYKSIRRENMEKAMEIIKNYILPYTLQQMVTDANSDYKYCGNIL